MRREPPSAQIARHVRAAKLLRPPPIKTTGLWQPAKPKPPPAPKR